MPLTNEQYQEVMRIYQSRRSEAQEAAMDRERELLRTLPAYRALDAERLELGWEKMKLSLKGCQPEPKR